MAALIKWIAETLKNEGALELSLGAAPGVNCQHAVHGDCAGIRKMIVFFYNHLHFIYDLQGVYEFKRQFRPLTRNLYVCCYPDQITLNGIRAFLHTFGVFDINLRRLLANAWRSFVNKLAGDWNHGAKTTG
jgi:lysylphosphatidylglycerol synthetase-like protein (DUF2156 family)